MNRIAKSVLKATWKGPDAGAPAKKPARQPGKGVENGARKLAQAAVGLGGIASVKGGNKTTTAPLKSPLATGMPSFEKLSASVKSDLTVCLNRGRSRSIVGIETPYASGAKDGLADAAEQVRELLGQPNGAATGAGRLPILLSLDPADKSPEAKLVALCWYNLRSSELADEALTSRSTMKSASDAIPFRAALDDLVDNYLITNRYVVYALADMKETS